MLTVLAASGEDAMMMMFAMGGLIAIIAIITSSIERVRIARAREESRREIAAYIAEGTIPPEEGRKLMEAGASLADKVREAVKSKLG